MCPLSCIPDPISVVPPPWWGLTGGDKHTGGWRKAGGLKYGFGKIRFPERLWVGMVFGERGRNKDATKIRGEKGEGEKTRFELIFEKCFVGITLLGKQKHKNL